MKKTTVLLTALTVGLAASAQITITQSDIATAGQALLVAQDTASGVSVGAAGANQSWDFSSLPLDVVEDITFADPATTLSASLFPNADLAQENPNDTLFYKLTATEWAIDGQTGDILDLGFEVRVPFSPDLTILQFPSTFNDNFTSITVIDSTLDDTFTGTADSLRLRRIITLTSDIDAFGEVITPVDTFNVIRQYRSQNIIDTLWAKFPVIGWQFFTALVTDEYRYLWWANGEDTPVLDIVADAPNGNAVTASYKIGASLLVTTNITPPTCNGDCDAQVEAVGLSGSGNYTYQWDAAAGGQTTALVTGLCAGTYNVTVSDGVTTVVETVEVPQTDALMVGGAVLITPPPQTEWDIDVIVMGGTPPITYSWSGPNGFTATTQDVTATELGVYVVTVTDANGCSDTETFDLNPLNVATVTLDNSVQLYPNPVRDALTFRYNQGEPAKLEVMDLLGNRVRQVRSTGGERTVNVSGMAPGIYLVRITTGTATISRKIEVVR